MHKFTSPPRIETDRLILGPYRNEEFERYAEIWASPIVTKFIGGKPCNRQQTWTKVISYMGHWMLMGFGYWSVREKSTEKPVGDVGFLDMRRDLIPSIEGIPEIGWAFHESAHGKGYATEAIGAILKWSETHFNWPTTACLIHPDNIASIRLAQKFNYRESCRTTLSDQPVILSFRTKISMG